MLLASCRVADALSACYQTRGADSFANEASSNQGAAHHTATPGRDSQRGRRPSGAKPGDLQVLVPGSAGVSASGGGSGVIGGGAGAGAPSISVSTRGPNASKAPSLLDGSSVPQSPSALSSGVCI